MVGKFRFSYPSVKKCKHVKDEWAIIEYQNHHLESAVSMYLNHFTLFIVSPAFRGSNTFWDMCEHGAAQP